MRTLSVFNTVSLDGFFTDARNDLTWFHKFGADPEYGGWIADNAKRGAGGAMLFGRKTYDMMSSYWPTPEAARDMPVVADGMNRATKFVVSRSLTDPKWSNTSVLAGNLVEAVKQLKGESGPDIVLMGSGQIVAQLTAAGLIDSYQLPHVPVVLGKGRTMFEGVEKPLDLKLANTRSFKNGIVVLTYERG